MIFETHAHYDDAAFDADREEVLSMMRPAGVAPIINVSDSLASVQTTLRLAQTHEDIYASVGVHPDGIGELNEEQLQHLKDLAAGERVVAIGEIGLDYHWEKEKAARERQRFWFGRQIDLARACGLPIIVHSRDAAADTLSVMQAHHAEEVGGVLHCYSYSPEMAQTFVRMGFCLGIGGVLTFKNAKKLAESVRAVPLHSLLLETDSPYLAPEPYRGRRNCSLYLPYVSARLAQILQIDQKEVEDITSENAYRIFFP